MTRIVPLARFLGLLIVVAAGIWSIVATSPPPLPELFVLTLNDDEEYGYYYSDSVFACEGESVLVRWNTFEGNGGTLTTEPAGNLDPDLRNRAVTSTGELTTVVLGEVVIIFRVGSDPDAQREIQLIPPDLCTGFPVDVVGRYEGTLDQTDPDVRTLERALRFYWDGDALRATLSSDTAADQLTCTAFVDDDRLVCRDGEVGDERLLLDGLLTAAGYQGSYQGLNEGAGVVTPFAGSFDFQRPMEE